MELDHESIKGIWNLALIEKRRRNYHKAIELYARAYQIDPKETKYWIVLGQCYKEIGRGKEAKEWAVKYLESNEKKYIGICYELLAFGESNFANYPAALGWHLKWAN